MKYRIAMLMMIPAVVMAGETEPPEHGLAGVVMNERSSTATERVLDQQRRSPRAEQSEISVPIYIDTQKRLAESFRIPIPETFGSQTREEN